MLKDKRMKNLYIVRSELFRATNKIFNSVSMQVFIISDNCQTMNTLDPMKKHYAQQFSGKH